jgi:hypothetical protein
MSDQNGKRASLRAKLHRQARRILTASGGRQRDDRREQRIRVSLAVERAVRAWAEMYSLSEAEADVLRRAALGDDTTSARSRRAAWLRRTGDSSLFAAVTRLLREALGAALRGRSATAIRPRHHDTLENVIEQLRDVAEQPRSDATRYAMGAIVNELRAHPKRYGRNAVSVAAAAIGEDIPGLYRFATVAERWREDKVMALLKPRKGRRLLWSHLVAIAPVTSAAVRRRFLRRALREQFSVRQLVAVLEAEGHRVTGGHREQTGVDSQQ